MSHNTFGHLFRVTTWGESHGPALGCVVDGCPPGLPLTPRPTSRSGWTSAGPGQGKFVTQRQEPDQVRILSGVFEDERTGGQVTTGTPISLMIENVDQRSRDYSEIATAFRPGHADFTYFAKYGVRDYRGGGRASARETAARVAAGAVARKVLGEGVQRRAAPWCRSVRTRSIASRWDWDEVGSNPFWCPDAAMVEVWEAHLETIRKAGSSTGAVVEVEATGVPAGWGAPIYGKLDAEIAGGADVDQRRQGGRDRRGLRGGGAHWRGERRRDADGQRRGRCSSPTTPAACWAASPPAQPVVARVAFKPTSLDPHARAARSTRRRARSRFAPRAATTLASASAPRRWSRRCWPACWPTPSCATAGRPAAAPGAHWRDTRRGVSTLPGKLCS